MVDSFSIVVISRKDATLKELCSLIKQVNADARKRTSTLEFTAWYNAFLVIYGSFYTREGKLIFNKLGSVCGATTGKDDRVTLESRRFKPGDHLCVVIRERQRYNV